MSLCNTEKYLEKSRKIFRKWPAYVARLVWMDYGATLTQLAPVLCSAAAACWPSPVVQTRTIGVGPYARARTVPGDGSPVTCGASSPWSRTWPVCFMGTRDTDTDCHSESLPPAWSRNWNTREKSFRIIHYLLQVILKHTVKLVFDVWHLIWTKINSSFKFLVLLHTSFCFQYKRGSFE